MKKKLKLLRATKLDLITLFKWRNDSFVRNLSFNNNKISIDQHKLWFKKKIKEKNNLWILRNENKKCGVVYINKKLDKTEELSYLISKKFRRKGLATPMLKIFLKKYKKHSMLKLIARVLKKNKKSISSLKTAGFKIIKINRNYLTLKYIYK